MGIVDAAQDALGFVLVVAFWINTDIANLQRFQHIGWCLICKIGEHDFLRKWEAIQHFNEFSQVFILTILGSVIAFQDVICKGGGCFGVKAE